MLFHYVVIDPRASVPSLEWNQSCKDSHAQEGAGAGQQVGCRNNTLQHHRRFLRDAVDPYGASIKRATTESHTIDSAVNCTRQKCNIGAES